jgi:hypothetical protein
VASGVRGAKVSVAFMHDCLWSIKPCRDPLVALDQAGIFSGALAASVLRGKVPSRRLLEEWQRARRQFWMVAVPASFSVAVGAPLLSLLVNEPLVALFALAAVLATWSYRHYWFLKKELTWFGL